MNSENPEEEKFDTKRGSGEVVESGTWEDRPVSLRHVRPEDHQAVVDLIKARWEERSDPKFGLPETTREEYKQKLSTFPKKEMEPFEKTFSDPKAPLFILMTVGDNAVGYIELGVWQDRDQENGFTEPAIWIGTISLLSDYQGTKFQKQESEEKTLFSQELLECGISEARKEVLARNCKKVRLSAWMPRAIAFWKKEHFQEVGKTKTGSLIFEKDLEE